MSTAAMRPVTLSCRQQTLQGGENFTYHIEDKLEVEEYGKSGLKFRTDKPHLVSFGGRRVSTAITLLSLQQGATTVGCGEDQDIRIQGDAINEQHCRILYEEGRVRLFPIEGSLVTVDGLQVEDRIDLSQGCMICLGQSLYFRFNHPDQAMRLEKSNRRPESLNEIQSAETAISTTANSKLKGQLQPAQHVNTIIEEHSLVHDSNSEKYADELAVTSFRNKLQRFEHLSSSPLSPEAMSPPSGTKFPYRNYIGEKLFTKDTNTTRFSLTEDSDELLLSPSSQTANNKTKPPPPKVKPKPIVMNGKHRPNQGASLKHSPTSSVEFKTLSMISTDTSIWGSTSSAGTIRMDEEISTPGLDAMDYSDVFSASIPGAESIEGLDGIGMTSSYTQKHQLMVEERKLEEAMERKEQERLEEILAMCAQYEQEIDSEIQIKSLASDNPTRSISSPKDFYQPLTSTSEFYDYHKQISSPTSSLSPSSSSSTSQPSLQSLNANLLPKVPSASLPASKQSDNPVAIVSDVNKNTTQNSTTPKLPKISWTYNRPTDLTSRKVKDLTINAVKPVTGLEIMTQHKLDRSYHDQQLQELSSPDTPQKAHSDVMSSSLKGNTNAGVISDRKRNTVKTNGSLIQSPTSPPPSQSLLQNGKPKTTSESASTPSSPASGPKSPAPDPRYQDDSHLYDCPADMEPKDIGINQLMLTSVYADDSRIYDTPAEIFDLPPPVPPHTEKNGVKRTSSDSLTSQPSTYSSGSSTGQSSVLSKTPSRQFSDPGSSNKSVPVLDKSQSVTESPSKLHHHQQQGGEIKIQVEQLKKYRADVLQRLTDIKQQIQEMEARQHESVKELELEQALLQGEQQTELELLQTEWQKSDSVKSERVSTMNHYSKQHEERLDAIEKARQEVGNCEENRIAIEKKLRVASDEEKDDLLTEYEEAMDLLETKKRHFEDLEFQQLEMEAKYEEETESVQSDLSNKQEDLMLKIRRAEQKLASMTKQQTDMMLQTKSQLTDMEAKRQVLVNEFNKEKEKMLSIDARLRDVRRNMSDSMTSSQVYNYQPLDDALLCSPNPTLNKDLLARLKTGDNVMEEEIRRLQYIKQAATEASIMQWHEQRSLENNIRRFGTLDSEDDESNSVRSSETPSDLGDKISYNSSTDDADRFTELQALLAQARQHVMNADSSDLAKERQMRTRLEQQLAEEKAKRAELVDQEVIKFRENPNIGLERPLTRYLPIRKNEFDLRSHVESTGHNLSACPFVEVTSDKCKGYLLKMGTKVKTWNKRWFVFDRTKKALLYYMDKSENKPRGGVYFQTIQDVFVDHLRTVKSPNSKFTFCVKTYDKSYYLIAKSPEALSIWIDVIFTGAEGYQEF